MSILIRSHGGRARGSMPIAGVSREQARREPAGAAALSLLDAGFLYLDRPDAPLQIGAVLCVDGTDLHDATLALLAERLRELPRFRQLPRRVPLSAGYPRWEPAADFDPADHVFAWAVPASEGDPAACRQLRRLLADPLPARRPLWDLHLFESASTRSTALLFRAHHCMLDGLGGLACLDQLLDRDPDAPRVEVPPEAATGPDSAWERLTDALAQRAQGRRNAVVRAARALRSPAHAGRAAARAWRTARGTSGWLRQRVPEQRWNRRLGHDRQLATASLPLDRLREIRRARGCSFNDVLLCVIGGGLSRYLMRQGGAGAPVALQALVPVSRRAHAEPGGTPGNRIAALRVSVPVDGVDEPDRLARIHQTTRPLMARRAWEAGEDWLALLDLLPPAVVAPLARVARVGRIANLIVTSVPGPGEKRSFCGRPVHEIRPVVPIYHDLGLGVAALSYAGQLSLTLHADAQLVPDLDRLAADVTDAGVALYHATLGGAGEEAR